MKKRLMDEVTNDYGCGNRRKSGTVGYLLNQSSAEYFDYRGEGSFVDSFASSPLLSGDGIIKWVAW